MDLFDQLQTRIVCGDGAIGTVLLESGVPLERCFEELCVSDPDRIRAIHEQYIAGGARVIQTNTFGANAVRLERKGFEREVAEINHVAVQLALEAARDTTPDSFAQSAREMVAQGARFIGGCCGTTPTHIRAIAGAIAGCNGRRRLLTMR